MAAILCNGKKYTVNKPGLVACLDGTSPEYITRASEVGLMPTWEKGYLYNVISAYPTMTNPNNVSIITGLSPDIHGVGGNSRMSFIDGIGKEQLISEDDVIKCPTILEEFSKHTQVLVITTKSKLFKLLSKGLTKKNSMVLSVEELSLPNKSSTSHINLDNFGFAYLLNKLGKIPTIYEPNASIYCLQLGLEILKNERNSLFRPSVIYLSTTDMVQHSYAPGTPEANCFYDSVDKLTGEFIKLGIKVGMTADHGMNAKNNVIFVHDKLVLAGLDEEKFNINRSIKDPYMKHHDAIGSHMQIFIERSYADTFGVLRYLNSMDGVYAYWNDKFPVRSEIVLDGDKNTAFGTKKTDHNQQIIQKLRTHGGSAERIVPLYLSEPPCTNGIPKHNYDIFSAVFAD